MVDGHVSESCMAQSSRPIIVALVTNRVKLNLLRDAAETWTAVKY